MRAAALAERHVRPVHNLSLLRADAVASGVFPSVLAAVRSASSVALGSHRRYRLDVLADGAAIDARLRRSGESAPAAMIVELNPEGPGPVAPLVRTLTRHFPGVPLVVACTGPSPDGREVLGAANAGAAMFSFPPADDLGALILRLVGGRDGEDTEPSPQLPRMARRILAVVTGTLPPIPGTTAELAARLPMSVRTLGRRMQRNRWPAPAELLIWGRLLRGAQAADRSRDHGAVLSTRDLAAAAGFATVHGAATAYRRHAQVTLRRVVDQGSDALHEALVAAFPPPA
jgi:AraC-like DNA-binding protein